MSTLVQMDLAGSFVLPQHFERKAEQAGKAE
jgi:hypothetical protein